MHIETSAILALAVIAHAWITRIEGPPRVRNLVAWVMASLLTIVLLITGLVVR